MAEVTLEHVDKQYPSGVAALRDFSLSIADGELVVLVGPSGSGKTTTLRLIAGLEEPSRGTVRIGGRAMAGVPPRQRNVAMVFQRHSLYPHLSVRDNLAFGVAIRERRSWLAKLFTRVWRPDRYAELQRAEERCAERIRSAAELLGLQDLLQRRPEELSGGEQQRAALGRALVRQPAVFLLDEPLSHLEPGLRAELRRQLHLLRSQIRATMLYVTHDQLEAMALGDRVAVLNQGILQQVGRPVDVYERPGNRFVAGFFGWPTMNFMAGRLRRDTEGWTVESDGVSWRLPLSPTDRCAVREGAQVILGIRPEHVKLTASDVPGAVAMEAAFTEFLGSQCLITLRRHTMQMSTTVDAGRCPISGQVVGVELEMERCHLFDRSTGVNLNCCKPDG